MFRSLLAVTRLDLKLFFRDRKALIMIIAIPIGIASFIGFLTNDRSQSSDILKISVVLTDLDDSPLSRRVLANFRSDIHFAALITNADAARSLVLAGKYPGAIFLPNGFGDDLLPGLVDTNRKPVVELFFDPSRRFEKSVLEGLLLPKVIAAAVEEFQQPSTARRLVKQGLERLASASDLDADDKARLQRLLERSDEWLASRTHGNAATSNTPANSKPFEIPSPIRIKSEEATRNRHPYNGYAHSFAGMALQFVLMGMVDFAVNLIKDRETGLFQRLRAAPLSRLTLLSGKLLAQSVIAWISLLACFAFAMAVFHVRVQGSWTGFLLLLTTVPLMAGAFGLMLAALGGTPAGTRGIAIALVLILVMIGGAWYPSFLFPQWLQTVALLTPTHWVLEGFDGVTWRGRGLGETAPSILAILGFAALFCTIGLTRFRWRASRT